MEKSHFCWKLSNIDYVEIQVAPYLIPSKAFLCWIHCRICWVSRNYFMLRGSGFLSSKRHDSQLLLILKR